WLDFTCLSYTELRGDNFGIACYASQGITILSGRTGKGIGPCSITRIITAHIIYAYLCIVGECDLAAKCNIVAAAYQVNSFEVVTAAICSAFTSQVNVVRYWI